MERNVYHSTLIKNGNNLIIMLLGHNLICGYDQRQGEKGWVWNSIDGITWIF